MKIKISMRSPSTLLSVAISVAASLVPAQAWATSVNVTASNTAGLVAAFAAINAHPTWDYHIQLATGTFSLTSPLTINAGNTGGVWLTGSLSNAGQYIIDGQNTTQLLVVSGGRLLLIDGVTFQNGHAKSNFQGGAISASASQVTVKNSVIRNNKADQPGGGIAVGGTATLRLYYTTIESNTNTLYPSFCKNGLTGGAGGLFVTDSAYALIDGCTFAYNGACEGGAIEVGSTAHIYAYNSTFGYNTAGTRGGAIAFMGGTGVDTVIFNTISQNTAGAVAQTSVGNYGGGISFTGFQGTLYAAGNILASNSVTHNSESTLGFKGSDCFNLPYMGSTFVTNATFNAVGDISNCNFLDNSGNHFVDGTEAAPFDVKLGAFSYYGADPAVPVMQVFKPLSNSPMLQSYYSSSNCTYECPVTSDGRGFPRHDALLDYVSDFGAIEATDNP
jgi:hypothetical protein